MIEPNDLRSKDLTRSGSLNEAIMKHPSNFYKHIPHPEGMKYLWLKRKQTDQTTLKESNQKHLFSASRHDYSDHQQRHTDNHRRPIGRTHRNIHPKQLKTF